MLTLQDYQQIIKKTAEHFGVYKEVVVRVKDIKRGGRAHWRVRDGKLLLSITLPKWLEEYDDEYAKYYAVHEICHLIEKALFRASSHEERFKRIEDEALALWGLKIKRAKAYPKELYFNGQRVENIIRKRCTSR